jgi:trehalose 6-phosphate phosphatase
VEELALQARRHVVSGNPQFARTEVVDLQAPPLPPVGSKVALFLDLDGTLAPIALRPDLVALSDDVRDLIGQLNDRLGGAVAILSGRTLQEIDALVAPLALAAAGVHGAQLRCAARPDPIGVPPEWARTQVEAACAAVDLPNGTWMEAKAGISFAFHYRGAPESAGWIAQQARSIAGRTGGTYTVQFGDCIAEVKPANSDKGTALLALMQTPAFQGRTPVMIGDDLTDEAAFAEARMWEGRGILVGKRATTAAMHRLESPAEVHGWLRSLLHSLESEAGMLAT